MKDIKIGLQIHSLREAFAENPTDTLKRIKEMGYSGVEFSVGALTQAKGELTNETAEYFKKVLEDAGLECFGILTSWALIQPENLEQIIAFNKALNSPFLVIGSVPRNLVETKEDVEKSIAYMKEAQKIINDAGIVTGYHNHDSDFFNVIEGKTYFEHIFDNMPDDFVMLLDTGNAKAAGFDSIELLEKYPHRSPFLHIKGYSDKEKYLAWIGKDDFDWDAVCECALTLGGSVVFDVEFGQRADYDPFERAQDAYRVISKILRDK